MSGNHYSNSHSLISVKDRELSTNNITNFLNERSLNLNHLPKNNTDNMSKLVNGIDDVLYKKANSFTEYMDNTTLETRIKAALIKIKISNTRVSSYCINAVSTDNEAVSETNILSQLIDAILAGLGSSIGCSTSDVTVNESATTSIEGSTANNSMSTHICDNVELNHVGIDVNNTHNSSNATTNINRNNNNTNNTDHHNYDPSLMDITDCEQSTLDSSKDAVDVHKASKEKLTAGKNLTIIYIYNIMYTSLSHVYTYLYARISHT